MRDELVRYCHSSNEKILLGQRPFDQDMVGNFLLVYQSTQDYFFNTFLTDNVHFYPHDAMLARSLQQRRVWTSVRLAVTRRFCACTAKAGS